MSTTRDQLNRTITDTTVHRDSCPVCGSRYLTPVFTVIDHFLTKESFEILECNECQLRFTQDAPSKNSIGRYYSSDNYISHGSDNKKPVDRIYHMVRNRTLAIKRSLVCKATRKKAGRLLDIGAGTGAFVDFMRRSGWDAAGAEPDQKAVANAKAVYGLELMNTESLFALDRRFDAITMWHVLEHVHDLHEYMQLLKSLKTDDGKIFIAVPNYLSKDAQTYGKWWAAYDVPRHLYHFSPESMRRLTALHGLRVTAVHPMWFDSFYVSMLSQKYRGGSMLPAIANGMLSNLNALRDRNRASSQIYVVC
jgi:2-polyprenyl-3-methyl-5-hydroxy-6-metoxy-1,4-benzoquinol methylase